ncbi:MAG TPA: hypothetical protein VNR42_09145 [Solirubrobacteraceae bacterium]|nr:hypothetical protein [Solirubrobacteraceae bacterium]
MRFAFIFKDELRAAETLYEALAHGVKLRTDQLVPAYDAERKLLAIATRALDRLRESGASSMTMDVASPGQMAMAMPAGAAVPAA